MITNISRPCRLLLEQYLLVNTNKQMGCRAFIFSCLLLVCEHIPLGYDAGNEEAEQFLLDALDQGVVKRFRQSQFQIPALIGSLFLLKELLQGLAYRHLAFRPEAFKHLPVRLGCEDTFIRTFLSSHLGTRVCCGLGNFVEHVTLVHCYIYDFHNFLLFDYRKVKPFPLNRRFILLRLEVVAYAHAHVWLHALWCHAVPGLQAESETSLREARSLR